MAIKKRILCILIGVKKGCQKTLYKYKLFFLTPYGRSQSLLSVVRLRSHYDY